MPVILTKKYQNQIENISEEVVARLANNDYKSFIYIAPTKRKIRQLQREFLNTVPSRIAPAFNLFTLETLAAQVYQIVCPPRRHISAPEQAVLIDEAIISVSNQLQFFRLRGSPKRLTRGTLLRIINVINALKEKGIYLSTLQSEIQISDKFEKPKLQDILLIYEKYEQLLGERFVDSAGLFKHINEQWDADSEKLFRASFKEVNTIFVSGFNAFADPEISMLNNLSDIEGIGMVVSFDYNPDNDEIFAHLKENYKKFLEMGFKKSINEKRNKKGFSDKIAERLFVSEKITQKISAPDVTIIAAPDRGREVEIIAKIIRKLIRENPKRQLDKICVATFRPDLYTKYFREIFEQYGIPANITDRYYLDQSPVVVAIMSLMMIHQRDFMVSDIIRALSSPYINLTFNGKILRPAVVYESAVILKISGGLSLWLKKIDNRIRLNENKRKKCNNEREQHEIIKEIEILEETKNILRVLHDLLKIFNGPMTPRVFKENLLNIIEKVNVRGSILQGKKSFSEDEHLEKDTRALEKFLNFIDEFLEILAFEGKKEINESLSFYLNRLRESITQVRYNIKQKYGYGIAVTSMDETRGLDFDVMFLAGLVDGEFPPVYQPEIFFSSAQRSIREKYHLQEHRYLFYQMLSNFTEHLYITYPESDGDNELLRSSFIEALTEVINSENYFDNLPEYLSQIIYTKRNAAQQIGLIAGSAGIVESELKKINNSEMREELKKSLHNLTLRKDVELSRATGSSYPEYRGVVGNNLDKDALNVISSLRKKVYSVTHLEIYGTCPFHYFAERLLDLNVIKEIDEDLTPLERGNLLHEVFFEFYTDRKRRGLKPVRSLNDEEFQSAYEDIKRITSEKILNYDISSPFWAIEKDRIFGSDNRKGLLLQFLELERSQDYIVSPAYFEVEFGSGQEKVGNINNSLMVEAPISAGSVLLKGKIDRIDTGESIFRIVDYKIRQSPNREDIELGVSLQLPVYLYVVEEILKNEKMEGVAGVYYILTPKVVEKLGIGNKTYLHKVFTANQRSRGLCSDREELKEVIQKTLAYVEEYVDKISRGEFPIVPKLPKNSCQWCDHKTICRIRSKSILARAPVQEEI
mgnify:CR=1 FL=1